MKDQYPIRLEKVSFSYKKKPVIQDFSGEIGFSEKILINGPSGSGKTTFLKLISGILKPTSGNVFLGVSPFSDKEKNRFKIFGYHFVDMDFFEEMSTLDNIYILPELMKVSLDKDWVDELYHELEMDEFINTPIKELSAGQRERISIIRSIVHKPKILILDEPGSHLDEALAKKTNRLIENYQKDSGCTIIISSHQEFIPNYFDSIYQFHADSQISLERK